MGVGGVVCDFLTVVFSNIINVQKMKNSIPVFGNNMILQKPTRNEQLTSISYVVQHTLPALMGHVLALLWYHQASVTW